jgi:xanthine dehydrogenase YagR molybdenum-binding subunit
MATGIGQSLRRVDGILKVTGKARYAADHPAPDLLHGAVVSSSITKGRILSIDTAAARAAAGVVEVLTHENRPRVALRDRSYQDSAGPEGSPLRPLYDDQIRFGGQPVASSSPKLPRPHAMPPRWS